jgi:YesN/AraC family two-component response regulator
VLEVEMNRYTFWDRKSEFLLDYDIESFWVAYVIESGECFYDIGSKSGKAEAKDILLCPPYVKFSRHVLKPLTFHYIRFNFNADSLSLAHFSGKQLKINKRIMSDCRLLQDLQYYSSDETTIASIRNHLTTDIFMTQWIDLIKQKMPDYITVYRCPQINTAIQYINQHFRERIKIHDIANLVHLEDSYFSRKFRRLVGISAIEFLERKRLCEIQRLLINTDQSLEEIAEAVGYCNGYYLSKIFSKRLHVSPRQFRQQHLI